MSDDRAGRIGSWSTRPGKDGREVAVWEVAAPHAGATILLVHENRGIDEYILDVVDAVAGMGYAVVVPDLLTDLGGSRHWLDTTDDPPTPRQRPHEEHLADLAVIARELADADARPVVGLGLCFGGELGWLLAAWSEGLDGLVVYYGVAPSADVATSLELPILTVLADDDVRVNSTVAPLWEALDTHPDFSLHRFGGTLHAFHNHRRPERHHAEAAETAWRLTQTWLAQRFPS